MLSSSGRRSGCPGWGQQGPTTCPWAVPTAGVWTAWEVWVPKTAAVLARGGHVK